MVENAEFHVSQILGSGQGRPRVTAPNSEPWMSHVMAEMVRHGAQIAPGALHRMVAHQPARAEDGKEPLRRAHAKLAGEAHVAAVAHAVGEGEGLVRQGLAHDLVAVLEDERVGGVDLGHRLGDAELDALVLRHRRAGAALLHLKPIDHRLGDAAREAQPVADDVEGEGREQRQAIEVMVVDGAARRRPALHQFGVEKPVLGQEHVFGDDVVAAGAAEPDRMPRILDAAFGEPQQREISFWRHRQHHHRPLAMIDAAREFPAAGNAVAAVGALDLRRDRHERARQASRRGRRPRSRPAPPWGTCRRARHGSR